MKSYLIVIFGAIALILILITPCSAIPAIDFTIDINQQYVDSMQSLWGSYGQVFRPNVNNIDGVSLYLHRGSSASDMNLTVEIKDLSMNIIINSTIALQTVLSQGEAAWIDIIFSITDVIAWDDYTLVADTASPTMDYSIGTNSMNVYPNGTLNADPDYDLGFKTYYDSSTLSESLSTMFLVIFVAVTLITVFKRSYMV